MPVTFTTALPDASAPTLDNGIEDEIGASWSDVIDNGWYRTRFRETSDSDWLTALSGREIITSADATTNWSSGSNATVSTDSNPSEDGTSVKGVTDSTSTQGSRWMAFSPGTNDDLSDDDLLQFWYYTTHTAGDHYLQLKDGSGATTGADFSARIAAGEGQLVQADLSNYTSVNLANITEYRWVFDGDGTGIDKTIYVDSVTAGAERVGQATSSLIIPYLEDGEKYEVQVRTETEHVTGAWTSSSAITTAFPTPTGTTIGTVTKTSVDLSWTDNSDNEDGFRIYRRRQYENGWGPWEVIADLAPNTTAYTDSTVYPDKTYEWYVEAYTEDGTVTGATVSTTSTDTAKTNIRRESSGWTVEIQHPSGETIRPTLYDDIEWHPVVNGLPSVSIPVPRQESWQSKNFEEAAVSVFYEGREYPVDRIETVEAHPDHYVLKGRGGVELLERVQRDYANKEAHTAAKNIIQNETSYATDVDNPASTTQNDTLMQSASTTSDFKDVAPTFASDTPLIKENGKIKPQQTCFVREGENPDVDGTSTIASSSNFSGGYGGYFDSGGQYLEWKITPKHDIPSSAVGIRVRDKASDTVGMDFILNGQTFDSVPASSGQLVLGWTNVGEGSYSAGSGYTGGTLYAGTTYTLRLECTGTSSDTGEEYIPDAIAVYDNRFSYFWDNDNGGSSGYLDGPEEMPDAVDVTFNTVTTAYNITGEKTTLSINDISNKQRVSLSNDGGTNWKSKSNVSTFDTSFTSSGSGARLRVRLSRYGSRTGETPKTGFKGQQLDSFDLYADLEDTPVLSYQSFDGAIVDVLNEIADYGNFVWEYHIEGGTPTIEWTQPGARTSTSDQPVLNFDVTKTVEESYDQVIVYGSAQPVLEESFTTDSALPSTHSLNESNLISAKEVVQTTNGNTTFDRGSDYEMNWNKGEITVLSGGAMSASTTYHITYEFRPFGKHPADSNVSSGAKKKVADIAGITSDKGCQQAALYLYQRIKDPLYSASIRIPKPDPNNTLVADRTIEGVPANGEGMVVYDVTESPQGVVLSMGSRDSVGSIVNRLQDRLSTVSKRT